MAIKIRFFLILFFFTSIFFQNCGPMESSSIQGSSDHNSESQNHSNSDSTIAPIEGDNEVSDDQSANNSELFSLAPLSILGVTGIIAADIDPGRFGLTYPVPEDNYLVIRVEVPNQFAGSVVFLQDGIVLHTENSGPFEHRLGLENSSSTYVQVAEGKTSTFELQFFSGTEATGQFLGSQNYEVDYQPQEVELPPLPDPDPVNYVDDTHRMPTASVGTKKLEGNFQYSSYLFDAGDLSKASSETFVLDARAAIFNVANSKNSNPTSSYNCDKGSLSTNHYPFRIYNLPNIHILGGLMDGSGVPYDSDWSPTYCNSAAILFKKGAHSSTVDGVRITGAWDAITAGNDSGNLTIKNSWFSGVRDDVFENDLFYSATIDDILVEDTFQGISILDPNNRADGSKNKVKLSSSLIRLREVIYRGKRQLGALFKAVESSKTPSIEIKNTVLAIDYKGGDIWNQYWQGSWRSISTCENNTLLWLSDGPIPSDIKIDLMPNCFTLRKGSEARELWDKYKKNWINCHPKISRKSGDPKSQTSNCIAGEYGGY